MKCMLDYLATMDWSVCLTSSHYYGMMWKLWSGVFDYVVTMQWVEWVTVMKQRCGVCEYVVTRQLMCA